MSILTLCCDFILHLLPSNLTCLVSEASEFETLTVTDAWKKIQVQAFVLVPMSPSTLNCHLYPKLMPKSVLWVWGRILDSPHGQEIGRGTRGWGRSMLATLLSGIHTARCHIHWDCHSLLFHSQVWLEAQASVYPSMNFCPPAFPCLPSPRIAFDFFGE